MNVVDILLSEMNKHINSSWAVAKLNEDGKNENRLCRNKNLLV